MNSTAHQDESVCQSGSRGRLPVQLKKEYMVCNPSSRCVEIGCSGLPPIWSRTSIGFRHTLSLSLPKIPLPPLILLLLQPSISLKLLHPLPVVLLLVIVLVIIALIVLEIMPVPITVSNNSNNNTNTDRGICNGDCTAICCYSCHFCCFYASTGFCVLYQLPITLYPLPLKVSQPLFISL